MAEIKRPRVNLGQKGATPRKDTTYRKDDPPTAVQRASPNSGTRVRAGVLLSSPRREETSARRQNHYAHLDTAEAEAQASKAAAAGRNAADSISKIAQDLLLAKQSAESAVELAAREVESVSQELETLRNQARPLDLSVEIPESDELDEPTAWPELESADEPEFEPMAPVLSSDPPPERPRTSRRFPNPTPDMFADYVITSPRGTKHHVYGKLELPEGHAQPAAAFDFSEDVRDSVTSIDSAELRDNDALAGVDGLEGEDVSDGVLVLDPGLVVQGQGIAAAAPAPARLQDTHRAAAAEFGRALFAAALVAFRDTEL